MIAQTGTSNVRIDADDLSDADRVALGLGVADVNTRFMRRMMSVAPLPDGFVRKLTEDQRQKLAAGYNIVVTRPVGVPA